MRLHDGSARKTLLHLAVLIEPDRQRLARFVVSTVTALGGDTFSTSAKLVAQLQDLREAATTAASAIDVRLVLEEHRVYLCWGQQQGLLAELPRPPRESAVAALQDWLKKASESADPELLRRRNEQITTELDAARQRAAVEMAELEAVLEQKKQELQESMRLAETDGLTGLFNRGAYDKRLQEAFLRCQRQKEALCLLLLDLDKFKEINDTHGHQYGDQYLKRMADALRSSARQHVDFTCRIGGDEFAIILFSDMPVATRIAGGVLVRMEARTSIGIAQMRTDDTVDSLIARADAALYEAKNTGRGRYVVADETTDARAING